MIITVKINEEKIHKLCSWDGSLFTIDPYLVVQSDDLKKVKDDFTSIEKLQIYQDDILTAEFTIYDTYSDIVYMNNVYVPGEELFSPALKIRLTKRNLVKQVERLDAQINPVINVGNMTLNEYKKYKLDMISETAQDAIFKGMDIEFEGVPHTFTYKIEDQINLLSLMSFANKSTADIKLPYHSSGDFCSFYDVKSIITIYSSLQLRSIQIQTYTNMLNMMIRDAVTKEEIAAIEYGIELQGTYKERFDEIVAGSEEMVNTIVAGYLPDEQPA